MKVGQTKEKKYNSTVHHPVSYTHLKASFGWIRQMMRRNGFALRRRTSLAQKLPSDYEEKLLHYQRFVINLCNKHNYSLEHIGNGDETPVLVDMTSNFTAVSYTHLDVYKRQPSKCSPLHLIHLSNLRSHSWKHFSNSSVVMADNSCLVFFFTASMPSKCFPFMYLFIRGNKKKSDGARSGE